MRVAVYDIHTFEQPLFEARAQASGLEFSFFETRLTEKTVGLAQGHQVICCFAHDQVNAPVLETLKQLGIELIALRTAGFNHVDIKKARSLGLKVVRVPAYSPASVAEHAVSLILALNRKIHRAYARVRELNFSLDGLVGFDLQGKTIGVVGTGKIGAHFARIMKGFGCHVCATDIAPSQELKIECDVQYLSLAELLKKSDIVSLHCPLTPKTLHLMNTQSFALAKPGFMLINTGRGALIETKALIHALKHGQVGAAGLDVYEEEEGVFFHDLSGHILQDDQLARLLTFPNVLLTAHQAFLTQEALSAIVDTTVKNIQEFKFGKKLTNEVPQL